MITTLILTKNHEKSLENTLLSVKDLGSIVVTDLGSKDDTVSICRKHGAQVYTATLLDLDYSRIRNNMVRQVETEWVFWLDPGEVLTSGHDYLLADKSDPMYRLMVLRGDLLMKEPRLWRKDAKTHFVRPVFEGLEPDLSQQTIPAMIYSDAQMDVATAVESLRRWKENDPLSVEPDYYSACLQLMCRKYEEFNRQAEHFLFQKKDVDASTILTKYYMASLVRRTNVSKALKLILECIAAYPLMAEFWCLLGDLYLVHLKEYDRAWVFYENALILGSQRLAEDTMPMEISKYDDYPRKMMEAIRGAIEKSVLQSGQTSVVADSANAEGKM